MFKQADVVLNYMEEYGSITSMDAISIGITRLAAVICQLKKRGILIKKQNERVNTRYGSTTIVRYSLWRI